MNWPPMLLHLRFPAGQGTCSLWLPFFLLYPLLLVLTLIALPFVLLAALIRWTMGKSCRLLLVPIYFWSVIFRLHGLKVDIEQGRHNILVEFI
jgi:hypothetical protein